MSIKCFKLNRIRAYAVSETVKYKLFSIVLAGLALGFITIGTFSTYIFVNQHKITYDYWIYAPDEQRNWSLNDWRVFIPAPVRFLIPYHGDVLAVTGIYGGVYSLNKGKWLLKYDRWFDPWSYIYIAGNGLDRLFLAGFDSPYILAYDGKNFKWIETPTPPVKLTRAYGWAENTTSEDVYFLGGDGFVYHFNPRTYAITKRNVRIPIIGEPWVGFGAVGKSGKCYFPEGHPPEQGGGIWEYDPSTDTITRVYVGTILYLGEFGGGFIALEQPPGGRQIRLVWTNDFTIFKTFLLPESIHFMRGINEFGTTPNKFHIYNGNLMLYVRGIVYSISYFPAYPIPWAQPNIAPLFGSPLQITDMAFYRGKLAVAFAGAYAGDRYYTIIALEDPSILFRYNPPPAYAVIWYDEFIISNLTSIPVITNGWSKKTLLFTSNTDGVLTVEGTLDGEKWMLYDRVSVSSNKPLWYTLTNSFYQIRLSFNVNATVTAIIFLQS